MCLGRAFGPATCISREASGLQNSGALCPRSANVRWRTLPFFPPRDEDDKQLFKVVVETPKGSRNKYAFDPDNRVFELKKVLPAGMAFPYDFGFLPSTKGGDGDPLDVLVLMDEPAFPGCVLKCRVIGVIEGEQGNKKRKERNDRLVAIEQQNHAGPTLNKSVTLETNSAVA
jgi:inorganic pyrophosphatase